MAEFHAEFTLALRGGTQLRAEAKHGVQAAVTGQDKVFAANLGIVNRSVALVHKHSHVDEQAQRYD